MAITRNPSTQVSSNLVKNQKKKRVAFEQSRGAAIPNAHLKQKNIKVNKSVDITSTSASQKVDVSKGPNKVPVSSSRLGHDSVIASGQLRSGKIRSRGQDSDTTIAGASTSSSTVRKPARSAAQIAHLQNLRAKRQSKQQARAVAKANAAAAKLAAAEAAKVAAKTAADAAMKAAAQAQRDAWRPEMRAVADIWNTCVEEETNEGALPITDQEREEAQEIVSRFMLAVCIAGYHITKLERVYNAQLEERYRARKERFASDREVIMFHGTTLDNVTKIMAEGFKVGGVDGHLVKNGSSMGYGVYTHNSPWNSLPFCSPLKPVNFYQLIALRCIPGAYGNLRDADSLADAAGSPTGTLVLKTSAQCLPRYIVHCKLPASNHPPVWPPNVNSFSKILQDAPKILFTKRDAGAGN